MARQIRWASVGRVAAIVAAAIAGIASLPALLGGNAPPPVPPDVGITPAPLAAAAPPPAQTPATPPHHKRRRQRPERGLTRPTHSHRRHHHPEHGISGGSVAALPTPTYVPSYAPPPDRGEFQIEG